MLQALSILAVVLVGLRVLYLHLYPKTLLNHPPGPRGYPFIGNLLDIPTPFSQPGPYAYYTRLASKYGEHLDSLSIFGSHTHPAQAP
jgi:hypothetical protein